MSISEYIGAEGPTFNIESRAEVHEILDSMHTQVMGNLPDDEVLLTFLEKAMNDFSETFPDVDIQVELD